MEAPNPGPRGGRAFSVGDDLRGSARDLQALISVKSENSESFSGGIVKIFGDFLERLAGPLQ
jgi:hypothetical protein